MQESIVNNRGVHSGIGGEWEDKSLKASSKQILVAGRTDGLGSAMSSIRFRNEKYGRKIDLS